jgi:hypothetical protein
MAFAKTFEDGLHTYRYMSEEGPFERSWAGLHGDWPKSGPTPFSEWAVNNNNREELALYLGLIWRLTEGLKRYAVPRFDRSAGMYAAGEPYALVDWEYEIDDEADGAPGRVVGFCPARSSVRIAPFAGPWQRENEARAALFETEGFGILKDLVRGLLADATGQLNLYALAEPVTRESFLAAMKARSPVPLSRGSELASALSGSRPPRMAELLRPSEIYVDLTVGVDNGYADVIIVQTLVEIDDSLNALLREYETAVEAYESEIDEIASVDEFNFRLGKLVAVGTRSANSH